MPDGHVKDPRMNTVEKEFGILVSSEPNENGAIKEFIYLKDEGSRFLTSGTPVTFDIQTVKVPYTCEDGEKCATVDVATNVRVDREKIKNHKVISKLNLFAEMIMSSNADDEKIQKLLDQCNMNIQENKQRKNKLT